MIFSDDMNMINVTVCMMVILIELYPFIPLSVTLIVFQGHSTVKQFQRRILCSHLVQFNLCTTVDYIKEIMNILLFLIFACIQGR